MLTRLDRKIQLFEPGAMATVAYTVINADHTTLSMSSAGHLPPLSVDTDRAASVLAVPVDLPVGAYPGAPRRAVTLPVSPGSALLFYTDGLIESRGRSVVESIEELRCLVRTTDPYQLCADAIDGMFGERIASDDVALLALRRRPS